MRPTLRLVPVCLTLFSATAAMADVTSEDVWNDMLRMSEGFGQSVTADLRRDGDTLIAENITFAFDNEEVGSGVETTIARMDFTNLNDGSVRISMPAPLVVTVTPGEDGALVTNTVMHTTVQISGDMIAAGDPDALRYSLDAGSIHMENRPVDGQVDPVGVIFTVDMEDVVSTWTSVQNGEQVSGDYAMTSSAVIYRGESIGDNGFRYDVAGQNYETKGSYAHELGEDDQSFENILATLNAEMFRTVEANTFTLNFDGDRRAKIIGTSGLSRYDASIQDGQIDYSASTVDTVVEVSSPDFPLPDAGGSLARLDMAMSMPVTPAESPAPLDMRIAIEDLSVTDSIWSMFDPSGTLSRDPATVIIDVSAMARIPEGMMTPASPPVLPEMPEISEVTLNDLTVKLAGAMIEGTGSATSQGEINGMPNMVGALDLKLTNVTTLIDQLAGMGLLPMEQAGMAQMMIGMLARPGATPGEMVAHIERTADGQILSNGMPLPF
ncbi:DUF2125 domain-containing protein [Celeribacter sp.]|uniref:DUF2125 domain-containing protein n=1 Tax=Celeribacter sp. TaxID=1890673 RepID=UPI003A8D29CB